MVRRAQAVVFAYQEKDWDEDPIRELLAQGLDGLVSTEQAEKQLSLYESVLGVNQPKKRTRSATEKKNRKLERGRKTKEKKKKSSKDLSESSDESPSDEEEEYPEDSVNAKHSIY